MALNKSQLHAVQTTEVPSLILAGAGSGKTTVIVERIRHLIENVRINPANILAITFANKAAREMKERTLEAVHHPTKYKLTISTFHSLCLAILKKEAHRTKHVQRGFKLYTPDDVQFVLKKIVKDMGYQYTKKSKDRYINVKTISNQISFLKNEMIDSKTLIEEEKSNGYQDWQSIITFIEEMDWERLQFLHSIYQQYERQMASLNGLDFDDLLLKVFHIYNEEPEILERYQDRFQYIMVDEFQDTNRVQYAIVDLLAKKNRKLTVVGDDYQSIYAFRGSDIRNILNFDIDYPEAEIIKLEQNYRSTKKIIDAANNVIRNNLNQKHKHLFTENEDGNNIRLYEAYDERNEARYITDEIKSLVASGKYNYKDIAILFRSNRKCGILEKELNGDGIPNKVLSGKSFFDRKEIKLLIYYIRFILDSNDAVFLQQIINVPKRNVGSGTIKKIIQASEDEDVLTLLKNPENLKRINQKTKDGMKEFYKLIAKYQNKKDDVRPSTLLEELIRELDLVKTHFFNGEKHKQKERSESLDQLIIFAKEKEKEFENFSLEGFIEEMVLDPVKEDDEKGYVKLMTMHASKGLEFPVVFAIGLDQDTFPSKRMRRKEDIEEERRLAYVTLTRAKERLFISYPMEGYIRENNGMMATVPLAPSIFINEIGKENISIVRKNNFYSY